MDWNSLVMVCTDSETVKSEGRRMNLLEEKDVKWDENLNWIDAA